MTFIQRAASTLDLFQDIGGASRPDEGFGILVVTVDVIADHHKEFFQIAKHAATQLVLSEVAEETLHHVEPQRTSRSEVHVEAWMTLEPVLDLGMFMGCVVIRNQVYGEMCRHGLVEQAQKLEPLLVAMPFLTKPVDLAVGRIEGGEKSS